MDAISGYSSPLENPEYDNFEIGHTSTSVALASGLQKARDIMGGKENVIAVIGDGSLSGGEALRAWIQQVKSVQTLLLWLMTMK